METPMLAWLVLVLILVGAFVQQAIRGQDAIRWARDERKRLRRELLDSIRRR